LAASSQQYFFFTSLHLVNSIFSLTLNQYQPLAIFFSHTCPKVSLLAASSQQYFFFTSLHPVNSIFSLTLNQYQPLAVFFSHNKSTPVTGHIIANRVVRRIDAMRRYSDRVVARSVTSVPNDVSSSRVARCAARVGCICETGQPASVNVCRRQTSHNPPLVQSSTPQPPPTPAASGSPAVARAPGDWGLY
jgi:hypothetical protein